MAFLNPVFWLVVTSLVLATTTWRSMQQLCCSIDKMVTRWRSWPVAVYYATPAAVKGAFPALYAVAKISRYLVGYFAGLIQGHFRQRHWGLEVYSVFSFWPATNGRKRNSKDTLQSIEILPCLLKLGQAAQAGLPDWTRYIPVFCVRDF